MSEMQAEAKSAAAPAAFDVATDAQYERSLGARDISIAILAILLGTLLCSWTGEIATFFWGDDKLAGAESYAALITSLSLLIIATLFTVGPALAAFAALTRAWGARAFNKLNAYLDDEQTNSARNPFRDGRYLGWTDITNFWRARNTPA